MSYALKFKKVGISAKILSNLSKVSKTKDHIPDSVGPGVNMNFVLRSKNPKQLMKFMTKFGIKSLVTLKLKPGYYTFKAKSLLNQDIEVDVEITKGVLFRYHILEGLVLIQDKMKVEKTSEKGLVELNEKIQHVKDIINTADDDVVEIPDELLEEISLLDTIVK